jgi:hypothetical protein
MCTQLCIDRYVYIQTHICMQMYQLAAHFEFFAFVGKITYVCIDIYMYKVIFVFLHMFIQYLLTVVIKCSFHSYLSPFQ